MTQHFGACFLPGEVDREGRLKITQIEKENHLNQSFTVVFHVYFQGCKRCETWDIEGKLDDFQLCLDYFAMKDGEG